MRSGAQGPAGFGAIAERRIEIALEIGEADLADEAGDRRIALHGLAGFEIGDLMPAQFQARGFEDGDGFGRIFHHPSCQLSLG